MWTHKKYKQASFTGSYKSVETKEGKERVFTISGKSKTGIKVKKSFESHQVAKAAGWTKVG